MSHAAGEERARAPARRTSIASGLTAGETVITEGGDRLRDGARGHAAGDAAGAGGGAAAPRGGRRRRRRGGAACVGGVGGVSRAAATQGAASARSVRMSPSRPFIQRPVATSLLMLAIVLAGLVGFQFLPLSALPQVDYPTIQVQTLYPGRAAPR